MAAGLLLCLAWYYTIISGFFVLYCPILYLMFLNHLLYRKVADVLFALWELYPVALFQWCCGTQLHHYGDHVNPDETTIIVMNHRTRVDWNYVWIALYHATQNSDDRAKYTAEQKILQAKEKPQLFDIIAGGKSRLKFVLKDEIKAVPGLGWIMQLNFFLYVKRSWQEDQLHLSQFADYYKKIKYRQRVILFPEGTDLSEDNRRRNEKYATANNLPKYQFVLHPRTTGWAALCSRLRDSGLASVYDVTVAYDNPAQTEMDLLRGNIPTHVHFYFKRYAINDLPTAEDALRNWLKDRWDEKNVSLEEFHKNGYFIESATKKAPRKCSPASLKKAKLGFVFWSIVDVIFVYALCTSSFFQFWVMYHSLLFFLVTRYFGGFQNIQYMILGKLNI